ncbi:MAG TPA: hypothetical protein VGQ53_12185 [Chitinophagaceae bacterium]|nr:hypothetical protein [Chitinophagaceae bacterium]
MSGIYWGQVPQSGKIIFYVRRTQQWKYPGRNRGMIPKPTINTTNSYRWTSHYLSLII